MTNTLENMSNVGYTDLVGCVQQLTRAIMHLENRIQQEEEPCLEGETDMAKYRQRVQVGAKPNGEPIFQWVQGSSQTELQKNMLSAWVNSGWISTMLPNQQQAKETPTFKAYAQDWLRLYKKNSRKINTVATYEKWLNAHIYNALGEKHLAEFDNNTRLIQEFLNGCKNRKTGKDLAYKTLHEIKALVSQILDSAVEDEYIRKNPCHSKRLAIQTTTETEPREAIELERFKQIVSGLSSLGEDERRLAALAMFTGCRRGEVLGIKWEDIDRENGVIHIVRNVVHPQQNPPIVNTPKTKKGKRDIPIDPMLLELLQPLGESGYIFHMEDGNPVTLRRYNTIFNHVRNHYKLGKKTLHVLRHSYLTYAASVTTDLKSLQTIAGHKDIITTLNLYVHPRKENVRALSEHVHALLVQ